MGMIRVNAHKTEDDGRVAVYEVDCSQWSGKIRYIYASTTSRDQWQVQGATINPRVLNFFATRLDEEWGGGTLPDDLSGFIDNRSGED